MKMKILVAAALLASTFLLSVTAQTSPYNPWYDFDDDGDIDIFDTVDFAGRYGTTGTPINKTELLLELDQRLSVIENFLFASGLVAYWKFDEGNGLTAYDGSGNNHTGTLENGTLWTDGKFGKALSLDGSDDYVNVSDSLALRLQSFTLEAWVFMTERPWNHSDRPHVALVNKMNYFEPSAAYGFKMDFEYPTQTDDELVISIGDGANQIFLVEYNSINDLTLNEWHQIVGTYDGLYAKLYIDGVLQATSSQSVYTIVNDDAPLGIGQEVTGSSGHFKGLIDSVVIYNRAITESEVALHYTGLLEEILP